MSLVSSLLEGVQAASTIDTSALEAKIDFVGDDFMESASVELMADINAVNEAYLTADIIGSVKVVTEGADPAVLMENIVTSAIERLKGAWEKFLAGIRKFFDKVITFFKSMTMSGEKFVNELGGQIKNKIAAIKKFKYNGYLYNAKAGNAAYDSAKKSIEKDITSYFKGLDTVAAVRNVDSFEDYKIEGIKDDTDVSSVIEKSAGNAAKGSTYATDIKNYILEKYRGDSSKGEHEIGASEVGTMLDVIKNAKKATADAKSEKDNMEKMIINIINKVDKIGSNIKDDDKAKSKLVGAASKLSQILNGLLNLYRGAADAKIQYYKESNKHYLHVLRNLLNWGKATESTLLFESDDECDDAADIDDDDVDIDEAAVAGADYVEGDTDDIGLVKESYGGVSGSIIEEAMSFLNR